MGEANLKRDALGETISRTRSVPDEETAREMAKVIVQSLYRARIPYIPGDKLKVDDFLGVAVAALGFNMAMEQGNGPSN